MAMRRSRAAGVNDGDSGVASIPTESAVQSMTAITRAITATGTMRRHPAIQPSVIFAPDIRRIVAREAAPAQGRSPLRADRFQAVYHTVL
jgi:hypothetical protein